MDGFDFLRPCQTPQPHLHELEGQTGEEGDERAVYILGVPLIDISYQLVLSTVGEYYR